MTTVLDPQPRRRRWRGRAVRGGLGLMTLLLAAGTITGLYQFWDVGSDSWVDRVKGVPGGLEFQMKIDTAKQVAGAYDTHLIVPRPSLPATVEAESDAEGDER